MQFIVSAKLNDTTIDLSQFTIIYDDTFASYTIERQPQLYNFKKLKDFELSTYHKSFLKITQWLSFTIKNKSIDTLSAYCYVGKHNEIYLYSKGNQYVRNAGMAVFNGGQRIIPSYYLPVFVAPNHTDVFYVSITNFGIVPAPIESKLIVSDAHPDNSKYSSVYYWLWLVLSLLISGGILILGTFNIVQYFTSKNKAYLYYGLYALMMFLNIERANEWNFSLRLISQFIPNYFFSYATTYNLLSGIFYLLFTLHFLDINKHNMLIYKIIVLIVLLLTTGLIVLQGSLWLGATHHFLVLLSRFLSLSPILCVTIVVVLIAWKLPKTQTLLYYVVGYSFLFVGVGVNIYINRFARHLIQEEMPIIFFLELGVLLEVFLFALGLGYKARLVEKQKVQAEIDNMQLNHESEIRMLSIRNRLSRDLHDDIGSTLSSINILSKLAAVDMQKSNIHKARYSIDKIHERSQRLLKEMDDIVWNIDPQYDSIEDVTTRMREYAAVVLEAKNIQCDVDFVVNYASTKLTQQVKSNLYLIFKEAINNMAKYAQCTSATLILRVEQGVLILEVTDNGIGFNYQQLTHQRGLHNMKLRAIEIGAEIRISSTPGVGTRISLQALI